MIEITLEIRADGVFTEQAPCMAKILGGSRGKELESHIWLLMDWAVRVAGPVIWPDYEESLRGLPEVKESTEVSALEIIATAISPHRRAYGRYYSSDLAGELSYPMDVALFEGRANLHCESLGIPISAAKTLDRALTISSIICNRESVSMGKSEALSILIERFSALPVAA